MNIEEVEEPETTRITTKNEHPRSWRAERAKKYEFPGPPFGTQKCVPRSFCSNFGFVFVSQVWQKNDRIEKG